MIEYFPTHGKWFAPPISDLIRAGVLKDAPCQRNAIEPEGGWQQHRVTVVQLPLVDCRECQHFGDELNHAEREVRELTHSKVWHECEAGQGPIALCNVHRRCKHFSPDSGTS
jgi:hypothetical protein